MLSIKAKALATMYKVKEVDNSNNNNRLLEYKSNNNCKIAKLL
jgi:hypothetical protein